MKKIVRLCSLVLSISGSSAFAEGVATSVTNFIQPNTQTKVNPWKFSGGFQQTNFKTRSFTAGQDTYRADNFAVEHYVLGTSIPYNDRISVKPVVMFGGVDSEQSRVDTNGNVVRGAKKGSSYGAGLDMEVALFKSEFDLIVGASYRYLRNKGGLFNSIEASQTNGSSVDQRLHTGGIYLAPTFTNKHLSLSLNLGMGVVLQEYVSGMDYYSSTSILENSFTSMGATVAYNL